jgi:hypothetical protein
LKSFLSSKVSGNKTTDWKKCNCRGLRGETLEEENSKWIADSTYKEPTNSKPYTETG